MESTRTTGRAAPRTTDPLSRPSQNSSNGSQERPGGSVPQGKLPTRRHFWLQWLIYIVIINLLFYIPLLFSSLSGQQPTINLSYNSFLQQVQQGTVKDVTLKGVLTEHRDALDRLAQALLQEEVLEREQVLAIVNGAQNIPSGAR